MSFSYYHPTTSATVVGEATTLSANVAASATTLPVVLSTGTYFVTGRKLLLGTLGEVDAELVDIADIPDGTSFTTEAIVRAHTSGDNVSSLIYDSVRMYVATSADGPWTLQETRPLNVANPRGTFFQYTGTTASHFRFLYYHTVTGAEQAVGTTVISPADESYFYTTIADYKAYAGITGVDQDEEIYKAINAWTKVINGYLFGDSSQSILSTTYTEKTTVGNAGGHDILVMQHSPITAVTSVTLDGTTVYTNGGASLMEVDAYEGYLIYMDGTLTASGSTRRKPVTVVYTAGYSTVPADVALACQKLVALSLNQDLRDAVGIRAYSIGSKRVEFDTATTGGNGASAIPANIQALLKPYKPSRIYLPS